MNGGFNRARQPAIPVPNRKRAARDHPHPERKTQYTHIRRQRIRARRCRSGREGLAACQKHPRVAPAAGWWHVRARAARQVAPRSRKDLRSTWHSASGKHKHASECGSVRGSVGGAATVAAPQERATHHEPDSSGTERNRSSGSKRTGYSGVVQLTPGPRPRTTQNTRPAPRLEHAYVTTGFDFGADRPVAPPLGHMSGRRRDSRSRSR